MHASVSDAYAQHTHKGDSIRISLLIYLIMFRVPQKKKLLTLSNGLKSYKKSFLFCQTKILSLKSHTWAPSITLACWAVLMRTSFISLIGALPFLLWQGSCPKRIYKNRTRKVIFAVLIRLVLSRSSSGKGPSQREYRRIVQERSSLQFLFDWCSHVPPLTRVLAKENIEEPYKKGHLCSSYLIGALPFLLWQRSLPKRI